MNYQVLRCTIYEDPFHPLTWIVRGIDLDVAIKNAALDFEMIHTEVFVVTDIFDVTEDEFNDEAKLIHRGLSRLKDSARELEERNMAISFYWNAAQLRFVSEEGLLANPSPAPLSVEQLKTIARQLRAHPNYKKQTITMVTREGWVLTTTSQTMTVSGP